MGAAFASIVTCYQCERSVLLTGLKKDNWLRSEGWKNIPSLPTCPKCIKKDSDKNYWVKRDILECSSSRHETFQAMNIHSMGWRWKTKVGRKKEG